MSLSEMLEYLMAIAPLVAVQLLIPPFSTLHPFPREQIADPQLNKLFDQAYHLIPTEFRKKSFVESLMLDLSENSRPESHTWLTHIFVHTSYNHLFSNLVSMISLGQPVYREFGVLGMNALFISGGMFAALPILETFRKVFPKAEPTIINTDILSANLGDYVVKTISKLGLRKTLACGSSGAVCTFLGCNFILLLRQLYKGVQSLIQPRQPIRQVTRNGRVQYVDNTLQSILESSDLFWTGISATNIAFKMREEYVNMQLQSSKPVTIWSLFSQESLIGHGVHIQGFLFGASVTVGMLYLKRQRRLGLPAL